MLAAVALASLALVCHGQLAPLTPEQQRAGRARGLRRRSGRASGSAATSRTSRADPARRVGVRRRLHPGHAGREPLPAAARPARARPPGVPLLAPRAATSSGGISVEDDWPREPYLLVRLTRDRRCTSPGCKRLARFPDNLRTVEVALQRAAAAPPGQPDRRDRRELTAAGFELAAGAPDIDTNTASVELITARTDHAEYFRNRYGPVTTEVVADRAGPGSRAPTARLYEYRETAAACVLHWSTGSSSQARNGSSSRASRSRRGRDRGARPERNRDGRPDSHSSRVTLGAPLGDRPVIDAATGRRAPAARAQPRRAAVPARAPAVERSTSSSTARRELGLPHGRASRAGCSIAGTSSPRPSSAISRPRGARVRRTGRALPRAPSRRARRLRRSSTASPRAVLLMRASRAVCDSTGEPQAAATYGRLRVIRSELSSEAGAANRIEPRIDEAGEHGFLDGYGDAGILVARHRARGRPRHGRRRTPRDDYAATTSSSATAPRSRRWRRDRYECREA